MGSEFDEFVQTLSTSGLMTAEEVKGFFKGLGGAERPSTPRQLVEEMLRRKKLTKFQAQAAVQGKMRNLVLGNYVILDKLGEGGMGQVFKARHRRMERIVALKVLPPAATQSKDAIERFQREVKAAARLSHPNVVTAYDADESGGTHFLVMELVEGTDLASLVAKQGRLPVDRAIDYTLQAAKGLEFAHSQGVIHRDIKPSNLLVDNHGTVKILDLGLARFDEPTSVDQATAAAGLTQSGQVMGTVDYMPPEQAADTRRADRRSDIYSLGCTLFFLISGKPIYAGDTLVEKLVAHREHPVPHLTGLRPGIPDALNSLFRQMVSKRPDDRPKSMTEVVAALGKCVAGAAAPAAAAPKPKPASRPAAAETINLSGKAASRAPTAGNWEHLSGQERRLLEIKKLKEIQQRREMSEQWSSVISAADRRERRKRLFRLFSTVAGKLMALLTALALLVGLIVAGRSGYTAWKNQRSMAQIQESIIRAVGPPLAQGGYQPVASVNFAEMPWFQPLPPTITFNAPLFRGRGEGGGRIGTLMGRFDRTDGSLEATLDLNSGSHQPLQVPRLDPVP
jgi:serine/threonine protein kinase